MHMVSNFCAHADVITYMYMYIVHCMSVHALIFVHVTSASRVVGEYANKSTAHRCHLVAGRHSWAQVLLAVAAVFCSLEPYPHSIPPTAL